MTNHPGKFKSKFNVKGGRKTVCPNLALEVDPDEYCVGCSGTHLGFP